MKFSRDCGCARAALLPPPLLLLLLVPGAAAASLPHADSSGEAELDEAAAARRAELPDSLRQAQLLHARAAELQDEVGTAAPHRTAPHGPAAAASGQGATKPLRVSPQMCEKFTVCQNSMEMLLRNNLNLPKVTEEDGCLLAGFNEARNSSPFCSNPVYLGQVLPAQKNCGS